MNPSGARQKGNRDFDRRAGQLLAQLEHAHGGAGRWTGPRVCFSAYSAYSAVPSCPQLAVAQHPPGRGGQGRRPTALPLALPPFDQLRLLIVSLSSFMARTRGMSLLRDVSWAYTAGGFIPQGCKKAAGGRSAARPPDQGSRASRTPETGCQRRPRPLREQPAVRAAFRRDAAIRMVP